MDRIIVLGGALDPDTSLARGHFALTSAGGRLTEADMLARRYPAALLVLSGGNARLFGDGAPEASVSRDLLIAMGVEPARIQVETRSRTTWENAVATRELLTPAAGTTLLVTSAAHMPRAVGAFRRVGLAVVPWPCAYTTAGTLPDALATWGNFAEGFESTASALHEWGGLLVYWLEGESSALFPS